MIAYALSLANSTTSALLNSSPQQTTELYSGCSEKSIETQSNIELLGATIKGHVESILGHIRATRSEVGGNIKAASWIKLDESTAENIFSSGSITLISSRAKSVLAAESIDLRSSSITDELRSNYGEVSSYLSEMGRVYARGDIELINSRATSLDSSLGKVTIKQCEPKQDDIISSVSALKDVNIENGNLQNVSCRQRAIIKDSYLESLFLYLDEPQEEALLDLQGTEVKEKITVQIRPPLFPGVSRLFTNLVGGKTSFAASEFSLFVVGGELPKNIEFVGFNEDEITTQKVLRGKVEGTLIQGRSQNTLFGDYAQKLIVL